jgi:hypothetical protein
VQIKYEVDEREAQMVIDAIAELPLKVGFNLFLKLNGQLREQTEVQNVTKAASAPKKDPEPVTR